MTMNKNERDRGGVALIQRRHGWIVLWFYMLRGLIIRYFRTNYTTFIVIQKDTEHKLKIFRNHYFLK